MNGYYLQFSVPLLPKMVNALGRAHWTVKVKEIKLWERLVFEKTVNRRPSAPLKKAKITFVRRSSVEPDFDGLTSGFKHVLDALKTNKIITDDKTSVVGDPTYKWEPAKAREGSVVVTVEEILEA